MANNADVKPSLRVRVQKLGTFLSGMVMPNIGVFIAWGFLAAFFIPTGWLPNDELNNLVGPIMQYLIPVLIGYTGGRMVHGARGGAIGALATMGVVIGADITMLIGGMVMGPAAAWLLKKFDKAIEGRIRPGLEMLVDNFSIGILGFGLTIFGYVTVTPIFTFILNGLSVGMEFLIDHGLLPLTSLFVQPAQVLFLNNAINHGIMIPIGVDQVAESGKSLLFLVEANGGVWTGVALAFAIFARGQLKRSAPAATLIMFLGGIAEVCFAYVLAKPKTILGPIAGNMAGIFTLQLLGGGTVGAVSPGSIIALIAMSPKDGMLANLAGYFVALIVTTLVTGMMILTDRKSDVAAEKAEEQTAKKETVLLGENINNLIFACDAGMGSSVMGVSKMKAKLKEAGLDISINHSAVKDIPTSADAILTSVSLADRVRTTLDGMGRKDIPIFPLDNLLDDAEYDSIIEALQGNTVPSTEFVDQHSGESVTDTGVAVETRLITENDVILGASFNDRWDAIRAAGQALVERGYVSESYIDDMIAREESASVYVGNNIALPHGIAGSEESILSSGVVCIQVPEGVSWGKEKAYVLVAIAGKDGAHLGIISAVARVFSKKSNVEIVRSASDPAEIVQLLETVQSS